MSNLWSVLVPESTAITNLVTNPSIETATTGYSAMAGAIAADTTKQRRGYRSLKVTPTSATTDGVYYGTVSLTSGTTYTFSVDVWGVDGIPYKIYFASTAGVLKGTATTFTGGGEWSRQVVSWACDSTTTYRVYITKNSSASTGDFYIDGLSVAALDHETGYIDGEEQDCYWSGTPHASTSIRKAGSNQGGEAIAFDDLEFHIESEPGAGMAEVTPLSQDIGSLPGSMDAGEKIEARSFALVGTVIGTSLSNMHSKRQGIIDVLKSDRVKNKQQVKLVYSGGNTNRPVRIAAKYTGGLTMGNKDGFSEKLALRFLATDPNWYEDGVEAANLTWHNEISDADFIIRRVSGDWYNVSTNFNNYVLAMQKYNGIVYIGGYFSNVGDANGDYIIKWDGSALSSMGTGLEDYCRVIYVSPNGYIYVGGDFTSAGGVANTAGIAYWDPVAGDWNEVGGGITATSIEAIVSDHSGNLYVGGNFTNHGDANGDFITKYDGASWSSIGTGANSVVYALAIGPDGCLYLGGLFTTINGVTVNYVAKYDGTTVTALGSGMSGGTPAVYSLCFDEAGNLYAGGNFTSAGGVSALNVAKWNGTKWEALGSGTNDTVRRIAFKNGLFYIGGYFTAAGGMALAESVAVWNGSTWAHLPIDFPGTSYVLYILNDGDDLYLGGTFTGTGYTSYQNTLTNSGKGKAYPKFVFKQTGGTHLTPVYIKNETTGATLWLNYVIQDGETLTIDTALDKRTITSDYRGNVIGSAMLRNSDFSDFYLLPGSNKVSVFCHESGSPSATVYATWPITHWSLDGSA